jgi:xylulokinase
MAAPRTDPNGYGHVFGNPAGGFMSLICFTNGSLARENVARRFGLDWNAFSRAIVEQTRSGNEGNFLLPYFAPETTPRIPEPGVELYGSEDFKAFRDAGATVRAVVEAQALSMRRYSEWIGHAPERLVLTGGASRSPGIQRILADVFEAPVRVLRVANASALGAALRAAQATSRTSFEDLFATFVALDPSVNVEPDAKARAVYEELGRRLAEQVDARLSRIGA